ncbi:hypothetical protein INR49_004591, partial [Caranx melampygus]
MWPTVNTGAVSLSSSLFVLFTRNFATSREKLISGLFSSGSLRYFMLFTTFIIRRMSSTLPRHVIWESEGLVAYLHPRPWTPGSVILESSTAGGGGGGGLGGSIFQLQEPEFLSWLFGARAVAELLCDRLGVRDPCPPSSWSGCRVAPSPGRDEEHNAYDPGYCTSKTAPRWSDSRLTEIQTKIRAKLPSPDAPPNLTFLGDDPAHPGLFSRIVREEQQWRVWDDEGHVAFLTRLSPTPRLYRAGPTPTFDLGYLQTRKADYEGLVLATRKVSQLLEEGLGACGVGLIFEGFEIDYAHAKLIPLFTPVSSETGNDVTKPRPPQFYPKYPGYVTSEDGPEASPESLKEIYTKSLRDKTDHQSLVPTCELSWRGLMSQRRGHGDPSDLTSSSKCEDPDDRDVAEDLTAKEKRMTPLKTSLTLMTPRVHL